MSKLKWFSGGTERSEQAITIIIEQYSYYSNQFYFINICLIDGL